VIPAAGAALWLASAAADGPAPAKAPGEDRIHVVLQVDHLPPGGGGGVGGTWVHPLAGRTFLQAGGFLYSLGGSRWGYGQAGVGFAPADRTTALLEVNVGRGRRQGRGFPYGVFRANVTHQLTPGRLAIEIEDQYVSVDEARGNVVKVGGAVSRPAFAARAAVHASVGGNIGARYVSARLDLNRKTAGLLGGLAIGRTRPEIFDLLSISGTVHSTEVFVGARFPVSSRDVTVVIEHLWIAGTRRTTALLALGIPL
jgi:hypothetical protein